MQHADAILTETSHPANPQNLGAAPSAGHTIRDRSAKQRAFGPVSASKPQPTLARLRDVLTDLKVHGTCRHVAYELLTYWEPGGTVFPSVKTLAEGIGVDRRIVRRHVARLERIGLQVRRGVRYLRESATMEVRQRVRPCEASYVFVQPVGSGVGSVGSDVRSDVGSDVRSDVRSHTEPRTEPQKNHERSSSRARERCERCGRSWPATVWDGLLCSAATRPPHAIEHTRHAAAGPDHYGRRPQLPAVSYLQDRGHDDRCEHCDWTREAWDARGAT